MSIDNKEKISEALQKIIDSVIENYDAPESEKVSDNSYEYSNSHENMRKNYEFLKTIADMDNNEEVRQRGQVAGHGFSNNKRKSGTYSSVSGPLPNFNPDDYYTKYEVYSKSEIDNKQFTTKQYVDNTINEIAGDIKVLKETFLAFKSMFDLMKEIEKVKEGDTPSITEFYPDTGLGSCKLVIGKKTGKEVWLKPYEAVDANDKLVISAEGEVDIGLDLKASVVPEGRITLYQLGLNPIYMSLDNSIIMQIGVDYAQKNMVTLSLAGIETKISCVKVRDYITVDGESTCVLHAASRKWPMFYEERGGTSNGTTISNTMTFKNMTLRGSLQDNELSREGGIGGFGPQNSSPTKTVMPSANEFECGIYLRSAQNCKVDNVIFLRFRSTGLTMRTKSTGMTGSSVNSCIFEQCHVGLHLGTRSEYNQINNVRINNCNYGMHNRGGNNTYIMCAANNCAFAMVLASGSNDGHGNMTNGQLNHNMWSVVAINQDSGFVFIGMQMFYGDVLIKDCQGVIFETCLFKANRTIVDTDLKLGAAVGYNQFSTIMFELYNGTGHFTRTPNSPAGLLNVVRQADGSTVNWVNLNTSWYSQQLQDYVYNRYATNNGSGSTYTDTIIPDSLFNHGFPLPIMSDYVSQIDLNLASGSNYSTNISGLSIRPFDSKIKEAIFNEKGLLMTSPWRFSQGIKLDKMGTHEIKMNVEFISNPADNVGLCGWDENDTTKYKTAFLLSANSGRRLEFWLGTTKKLFNLTSDNYIVPGERIEIKYKWEPKNATTATVYAFKNGNMVGAGQEVNMPSGDLIIDSFSAIKSIFNGYLHSVSITSTMPE